MGYNKGGFRHTGDYIMKEVETKLYTSATAALEEQVKAELNIPDPEPQVAAAALKQEE
jgi:hypothetical protein